MALATKLLDESESQVKSLTEEIAKRVRELEIRGKLLDESQMNNLLQHLKEQTDPMMTAVLADIEHIFTLEETTSVATENGSSNGRLRRRVDFFWNSLIGPEYSSAKIGNSRIPGKITISCLEKVDMRRRVVPLPDSVIIYSSGSYLFLLFR
ncbi:hypothetical protein RDI58_013448 [Solanum bulbocastanum]|uniref:Uncharacterized protein n=1 Tax=Solanum bulbocastanum TaxID=147425 RepID=A0AAN8TJJ4_SOLBU